MSTHEDLLRALITGDRRPDDPAVAEALERDAALRAAWEAHLSVGLALEGSARLEEEVLADLERVPGQPAPGEERVSATIEGLRRDGSSGARVRRAPAWLAAAAVLLVSVGLWFAFGRGGDDGSGAGQAPIYMGPEDEDPQILSPRGPVGAQHELVFRWAWARPEGWSGEFHLLVVDPASPGDPLSVPVAATGTGTEWSWQPDARQLEDLRGRATLRWQVSAVPNAGEERVSRWCEFSTSSW